MRETSFARANGSDDAARAGATTLRPWGDAASPERANVWDGPHHRDLSPRDGYLFTAPVGSFPPNAWGLHDVIGNVFEYCQPTRTGDVPLVAGRGGSWWCCASVCGADTLARIGHMSASLSLPNQGFRVARDAP